MPTLTDQLVLEEGEKVDADGRLRPYPDAFGNITIGVGRNLTANGISRDESRIFLANDIDIATAACVGNLGFWAGLDPIRQRVFLDMCFNMGIGTLLEFQQTISAVAAQKFGLASQLMLQSKWATQVGKAVGQRAWRLSEMMRTGQDYTR